MVALSLIESVKHAKAAGLFQKAAIAETYLREADLFRAMQFMPITGSAYTWNEENSLPGIAFRNINSTYTPSTGIIAPKVEPLKVAGGEIQVDQALIKMHGPQQRAWQEMAQAKNLARAIGYKMIEGDSGTTPAEFDGLKVRVPTSGTQALALASAGALSMKKLDELVYMVDNPTHILCNKKTELNIRAFLRSGGSGAAAIQMEKDEFGRPLLTYAGLPILIADRNGTADTLPLGFTEASSTSSLFVLSMGMDGYHGIQNGEFEVDDLGKMTSTPAYLTRIEWLMGHLIEGPRSVARGYNFTDATAVA